MQPLYQDYVDYVVSIFDAQDRNTNKLDLFLLGQDKLVHNTKALSDTTWASPQARSFFYCLYFLGAQNKDQLAKRLWPEHSDYQVRNVLGEVRQRLKAVLPDVVVYDDEGYRLNPNLILSADVEDFDNLIHRAKQLTYSDARTESLYLQALALYDDGGLLPNLYVDFLSSMRHKYECDTSHPLGQL